jgi:hypothetical protein
MLGAEDAYGRTQNETAGQFVDLSDTIQWARQWLPEPHITGDETWVLHITPESKQQSIEWRHVSLSMKLKFKQTISTHKIMSTVFWDRKCVLLVEIFPQGLAINTGVCCDTVKNVCCVIQNKWRGMLSWGVVLLHILPIICYMYIHVRINILKPLWYTYTLMHTSWVLNAQRLH